MYRLKALHVYLCMWRQQRTQVPCTVHFSNQQQDDTVTPEELESLKSTLREQVMQRLAATTVLAQGVPAWARGPEPLWAVALEGGRRSCHIMVPVQDELQPALVVFKVCCVG